MNKDLVKEKALEFLKGELHFNETIVKDMPLKTYGLKTDEIADFIVEYSTGEEICPLILVSCVEEDEISDEAIDNLMDLSDLTMVEYAVITNGVDTIMFEYDGKENAYYELEEYVTKEMIIEDIEEN
ncbi:MAG: type I restriction enzyme HsdR N-terminal domain-containing protein [Clostridium sp.]|uniref:type I restriction enzyme HsdR N-terminal domain-containing protein n=1 Tax=Clostridium sp. TaxID=1506 RepID=UPI003F3E4E30